MFSEKKVYLLILLLCIVVTPIVSAYEIGSLILTPDDDLYIGDNITWTGTKPGNSASWLMCPGPDPGGCISINTSYDPSGTFQVFTDYYPTFNYAKFAAAYWTGSSWAGMSYFWNFHHSLRQPVPNFTITSDNYFVAPTTINFTDISDYKTYNQTYIQWAMTYPNGTIFLSTTNTTLLHFNVNESNYYTMNLNIKTSQSPSTLLTKQLSFTIYPENSSGTSIGVYAVSLTPQSTNPFIWVTGSILASAGDLANLKYIRMDDITTYPTNPNLNSTTGYTGINYLKNTAGHWQYYNITTGYTGDLGTATPNDLKFNFFTSGDHLVRTFLIDDFDNEYVFNNTVTILGNIGTRRLTIYPVDYVTGNFVPNSRVNVSDPYGVWTNRTVLSTDDCVFQVSTGNYIYDVYPPIGSSYIREIAGLQAVFMDMDKTKTVRFIPTGVSNATTCMVFVFVRNTAELSIGGATVSVPSEGIYKTTAYGSGTTTFNITKNKNIAITASKSGYNSATQYINTTGETAYVLFTLTTGAVTTGATTIPTPTATYTGAITPGAGGNYTGFWAPEYNLLQAMGATPSYIGLLMTLAIVFAGILIGGLGMGTVDPSFSGGSVVGGEAGAITGFICAVAFGWFPAWIVIVAVCVLVLFISVRVWAGGH